MTIIDVTQMWSRQTGSTSSPDRKKFTKKYSTAYQVVHSADATQSEIEAAPGIVVGDLLTGFSNVYCRNVAMTQKTGPVLSVVQVDYDGEVSYGSDDPTLSPPDYEYRPLKSEAEIDEDANGIPITTTCGEPVTGIKKTICDMVLRVKRNYLAFNGQLALQYMDSVNSDNFDVFGDTWNPGQAAMTDFSVKPMLNPDTYDIDYFQVSAEITLRIPYRTTAARAWWARYRNEGMYARYGTRVSFSGGGGTGAAGYAIAASGAVTNVVITSRGRGYTSAPTVSFSSDTGGTGASGTAVLGTGQYADEVVSVTVGGGGSGYRSGIARAVDANKEPVTKPVLLSADGSLLKNTDSAFWIERPTKQYWLNYTSLGLLD